MKKIIFLVSAALVLFISCDDIPNEVIDTENVEYQLNSVNAPSEFVYTVGDSVMTTTLEFEQTSTIADVWFNIVTEDGVTTLKQKVPMADDGSSYGDNNSDDGIYTGRATLGSGIASGTYVLNYFVEDNVTAGPDRIKQVASHNLTFKSGQENSPPSLSNLNFADTVSRGDQFAFSIKVEDTNGYTDIDRVFYEVFDPDGNQLQNSQGVTEFPMFDDGSTGGDQSAQDGIFTVALTFPQSFAAGEYRFELTAEDKVGAFSNTIIHILTVQ